MNIPEDFPRGPLAAVAGVQPKLAVRRVGDSYVSGWTDDERAERYDNCDDLVRQLVSYYHRKTKENPDWTHEFTLSRLERGVAQKTEGGVWDLTSEELHWIFSHVRAQLESVV